MIAVCGVKVKVTDYSLILREKNGKNNSQ